VIEHRGTTLREFDLDPALARPPGLGFVGQVVSGQDSRNVALEFTAEGFRDHGSEHERWPEETAPGC
jgi:K+-sensing histidine kinase KdpD